MYWKQLGNEAYFSGNYPRALEMYDKAISIDPTNSIFFSNKAKVLKVLGRLPEALQFAQEAIELDEKNYKGHLISGQVMAEMGKRDGLELVERALVRLRKALTLYSSKAGEDKVGEINIYIYRAKKLHWMMQFEGLKEARKAVARDYRERVEQDTSLSKEEKDLRLQSYMQVNSHAGSFVVPDHLICQITYELMEDPVVTEAGITYEREAIQEHIEKNGCTDPITRKQISGKLYPNHAIKKAVKDFLEKNPWAYEHSEGQSYLDISFS
ncbi:uncharacterized protein LOC127594427 [Hippocampus zosterae]|uniref:uncharacterized protein LOC127594427 n=1 Tax=Hippocampus zosterae TaxID=109293 RepID=UPI00223DB23F|nr:uncharacterized protein LOC127594427 [Hippocampus zosterae]